MIRGFSLRYVLVVLAFFASFGTAQAAADPERVVSPGGIEAWLVRDPTLPIVAVEFSFRGGSALDPAGKEGLAQLAANLLTEGAGDLDRLAFQRALEDRSISLDFNTGLDTFQGSTKTLKENRDVAADMLRLALTRPRFDAADIDRVRAATLTGLGRDAENPGQIARRTWMATAFPGHPYGRPVRGTPESVKTVGEKDMRDFVAARLARDNLIVGAVGDITAPELAAWLDRAFGGLPARATPGSVMEVKPAGLGRTIVIRRPVPQSAVVFGEGGLKRNDPDFYAATVMNYILGGGGFNSRLTLEVREKRGLAYSVYSALSPLDRTGLLIGGTASENARVARSLEVIREEWRRMGENGPSEKELADAKTYLTGSWALSFDSTSRIARMLVAVQYDKLGVDYFQRRNSLIEAVTIGDVRRVARHLLDPDRLLTVVVGEPDGLAELTPPVGAPPAGGG
ncbi:MAG: insulinase family protein [Rhodospirillales bacterium]|nr:insulinase family protein [Rhodospirillales bacterium]